MRGQIPTFVVDLSCAFAVFPISHETYPNRFAVLCFRLDRRVVFARRGHSRRSYQKGSPE
jgi:hypothetical protein